MLVSIAQVLGSDINTVLYGPPDAAVRERKLRRLGITAACLAVLAVAYWYLAGVAEDLAYRRYEVWLSLVVSLLLCPLLYGLLGWTVAEGAMLFAGLKPLRGRAAKGIGVVLAVLAAGYLLMLLSMPLDLEWLRGTVNKIMYFLLNLRGIFNYQTFAAIMGAALRLIVSEKGKL